MDILKQHMGHYIDADKLIAKIERLKKSVESNREHYNNIPLESRNELDAYYAQELILNSLIDTIDSLQQEQPEVDLEKEIENWCDKNITGVRPIYTADSLIYGLLPKTAHHFYELGLNAKKK